MEGLLANDVEFEMMGHQPGVAPIRGKDALLKGLPVTLKQMFPNGLNLKFHTVIAEANHVAIQGRIRYHGGKREEVPNRYHYYFRFDGDKIGQIRKSASTMTPITPAKSL